MYMGPKALNSGWAGARWGGGPQGGMGGIVEKLYLYFSWNGH